MSARRRAQLLLPTPLGLVEYDVLEDAVFLGPSSRGGLTADPAPFPEAVAALTWTADAFHIRALPGEAAPVVNGAPADGHGLKAGDRISIGGHVVAYRADTPVSFVAPSAFGPSAIDEDLFDDAGAKPPSPRPPRKVLRRQRPNPWVTATALAGALICLIAVYQALGQLSDLRTDERVQVYIPKPPKPPERRIPKTDRATLAFQKVDAWVAANPEDLDGALARYRDFYRKHPNSPEADQARARIREVAEGVAELRFAKLEKEVKTLGEEGRYAFALERVRFFERRFGATESGPKAGRLREAIREDARKALDALLAEVGPLVAKDARRAHRILLAAGTDFPPDLAAEVTGLMERALRLMRSQGPPPPERRVPRERERPTPPGETPGERPAMPPVEDEAAAREAAATEQWKIAYSELVTGRYASSLDGYSLLTMRYKDTEVYRGNQTAILAGRSAARAGAQGPAALLSVPAEEKRGRLEVEYTFDDARVVHEDFTREQPFPSDRPVTTKMERGEVHMSNASALFHVLVWEDDVRLEARLRAEVAHDFGVLAVAETDEYRAVMLNVNNTYFRLKKDPSAPPERGHLLWFMGEGVWADADEDFIGYIKIAERSTSKIENGDRLTLEFIRKGDNCEGSFHGRTDGVSLKGKVQGDDGAGMGPARLGIFVNTGVIVVEDLKISGKVDMNWFGEHLKLLVGMASGPED